MSHAEKQLEQMLASKRVPHALLFAGDASTKELATSFAAKFINAKKDHPDIRHYHPEGKSALHSIESLRALAKEAALVPFEAKAKVFIVHDADRMSPTSSNALLKTFEEPAKDTLIVLLTAHSKKILPTILSRCQTLYFPTTPTKPQLPSALLNLLVGRGTSSDIQSLATAIEKRREEEEKVQIKALPKEMGAQEKERARKEIEATCAAAFQEEVFALLEMVQMWYRDVQACKMGVKKENLFFPEQTEHLLTATEIDFHHVEKIISTARLAANRFCKLQTILQALFFQLS